MGLNANTSAKRSSRDLTEGNIALQLLSVAFPILIGQLLQSLYNSVDSLVVGNFVGTVAVAAIASCSEISNFVISFFVGLSAGSGVAFSSFYGAKNYDDLRKSIHTAITFAALFGLGMAALGILLSPLLLRLMDCPPDVYDMALAYLRIYLIGVFFTSVYNVATGVLRAVGDARTPLYYLIVASVTNIVLDVFFVVVFRWGIYGVAIATIASQLLTATLILRKMLRTTDVYRLVPSQLGIDRGLLLRVLRLGLPAALQSCMVAFANLFIQRYINAAGSAVMAGAGVAHKVINKFVSEIAKSLGSATSIFVGQHVGAKKIRRAYAGIGYALLINAVGVASLGIPIYYNAEKLIRLFLSDPDAIAYGVLMVTLVVPTYYLQSIYQVLSNAIRGFGHSTAALVVNVMGLVVLRQLYLIVATRLSDDIRLVFVSMPVGWVFTVLLSAVAFWVLVFKKHPPTADETSLSRQS